MTKLLVCINLKIDSNYREEGEINKNRKIGWRTAQWVRASCPAPKPGGFNAAPVTGDPMPLANS